jgi:Flp pilus assembly protein TadG
LLGAGESLSHKHLGSGRVLIGAQFMHAIPSSEERRGHRGVAAVEVAVVLPLAFLFMYAIFDYGRVIMTKQLLDNATRVAARQAVVGTTTLTTANLQTTVAAHMGGFSLQGMVVQAYLADPMTGANIGVAWNTAANGQGIAVQVSGAYKPIIPRMSLMPSSMALTSKVIMYCEAN